MRPWSRVALILAGAAAAAVPVRAQTELVGLDKVHQLFTANQARAAARELSLVSIAFRGEIGRCKDEDIGARLMELEPRIDALAARIGAGTVTAAALEQEFLVMDRLLAANHQQLASTAWGLRRFGRVPDVATELTAAVSYLERTARWSHQPLDAEAQQAAAAARATAERILADPANPPADTPAVIEALGKVLKGAR